MLVSNRTDLDAALLRNARLAVRLRRTIAALHRQGVDHQRFVRWTTCTHHDCVAAAALLVERFECERCHGTFPVTAGAGGWVCGAGNKLRRPAAGHLKES